MDKIEPLHAFEQLKILSDSRRMSILRLLMAGPATLTQLGAALGESPAWVRHHVKILESAGLIQINEVRITAAHNLNSIIRSEFDPLMKCSPDGDDRKNIVISCALDRFYFWRLDRKLDDVAP